MLRLFKILISLLGLLFLLAIAAVVVLVTLVNPNDYKTQISDQVKNYTGRELTLKGDIGWSFFPWLGIKLNDATISNAANFSSQPFAHIKYIDIKIKFLPLLHKQIEVGTLLLDGLDVKLIKNARGMTNWQETDPKTKESKTTPQNKPAESKHAFNFSIAEVRVTDGSVTWENQQKKQIIDLTNLELYGKNIKQNQNFPVDMQFTLQTEQPAINGMVHIKTQLFANTEQQNYLLKQLQLTAELTGPPLPNKQLSLALQGNVAVNCKQQLIQGQLQTNELKIGNVSAEQVVLQFDSSPKNITINPIQAKIYQGNYTGNIHIDLNNKIPVIISHSQLSNIQAEPLFRDLANLTTIQLNGIGNFNANLTTQGDTETLLIKNLNGQGRFALNNGVLHGINLPYWIGVGRSLIKKESLPPLPNDLKQTDFGNLTGTFTISNGMLRNNDLLLKSINLQATGSGTADLVNQQINYQLKAQLLHPDSLTPQGDIVPIVISGSFKSPSIRPEIKSIFRDIVKENYQKNKEVIDQKLQQFLGKDAGKSIQNGLENLLR